MNRSTSRNVTAAVAAAFVLFMPHRIVSSASTSEAPLTDEAPAIRARVIRAHANQDGRPEVFAIAADGSLYHRWQVPGGGWSGTWTLLAGGRYTDIAVTRNRSGRLFTAAIDRGAAVIRSQSTAKGGWPGSEVRTGQGLVRVSIGDNADGRLEVVAVGGDGVYSMSAIDTEATAWGGWRFLGSGTPRQLDLARDGAGRLTMVALGLDGAARMRQQLGPSGDWDNWTDRQGSGLAEVRLVHEADRSLRLLAVGDDGALYARGLTSPWTLVSRQALVRLSSLAVAEHSDGTMQLAAIGTGDQ